MDRAAPLVRASLALASLALASLLLASPACSSPGPGTGKPPPGEPAHPQAAAPPDAAVVTPPGAAPPYGLGSLDGAGVLAGQVTVPVPRTPEPSAPTACGLPAAPAMRANGLGQVEGALVWLDGITRGKAPPAAPPVAEVAFRDCSVVPRVALVAALGGEVAIHNDDDVPHDVVIEALGAGGQPGERLARWWMPLAGQRYTLAIARPGLARVRCALHPGEEGWLAAPPHPYHAVTAAGGRFELGDVPPGTYVIRAWHPGTTSSALAGETRFDHAPRSAVEATITLTPTDR